MNAENEFVNAVDVLLNALSKTSTATLRQKC